MASIYKPKNSRFFWGRVYRKGQTHRQSLKTATRSVAEKRLKKWVEELDAAGFGEGPEITFDDMMVHFLTTHATGLKPRTQTRYKVSARALTPFFEGLGLRAINQGKLAEFETARRAAGAKPPTIRRDLALLAIAWEVAIAELDCEILNPVPAYKKRRKKGGLRESPPRTRYLSHDEEERLLKACIAPHVRPMIEFAIDTGLRRDEQFYLTWDQVDLVRGEIRIPVERSKTGQPRIVPLLPRALKLLKEMPRHIRSARKPSDIFSDTPRYVFCNGQGNPYARVDNALHAAMGRAKIKDLRWHDLRRTCGCRLLQDHRMPIEQVSKWLGHSTVAQTERAYAFLEVDQLHATIRASTKLVTGDTV